MRISRGMLHSEEFQKLLFQVQLICLLLLVIVLSGGGAASTLNFAKDEYGSHYSLSQQQLELRQEDNVAAEIEMRINNTPPPSTTLIRSLTKSEKEVIVQMGNEEVMHMAMSSTKAHEWVAQKIIPHTNTIQITAIAVGNEILEHDNENLSPFLLPAMRNLHKALMSSKLDKNIKVSTRNSILLLASSSLPDPSLATFDSAENPRFLEELLYFLSKSQSPFIVNLDMFGVYEASELPVEYFIFKPNSGHDDLVSKLHYNNFLDTVVDSLFSAMAAVNQTQIPITVVMNPWPSNDHHAITFNQNLFNRFFSHQGTPMKPNASIQIFMDAAAADDNNILSVPTTIQIHQLSSEAPTSRPRPRRLQEQWCVAKPNQASATLQGALDWACGPLQGEGQVDCSPIQSTGTCYMPNTLQAHCNWAFNTYYQEHSASADSCNFAGSAVLTTIDPSTTGCIYSGVTSSGNSSTGSPNFNTSTGNISSSPISPSSSSSSPETSSIPNGANEIEQRPSFRIAMVVAIMYFLSGQAL